MSEKTEKATPKKRRDAREEGNVLRSTELATAISMLALFGILRILITFYSERAINMADNHLRFIFIEEMLDNGVVGTALMDALIEFLILMAPILLSAMIIGVLVNVLQTGLMFTTKALMPKFSRINPLSGLKRMFSSEAVMNLVKSVLKVVLIAAILYGDIVEMISHYATFMYLDLGQALYLVCEDCISLGLKAGMAFMVLAIFDLMYQFWKYEKDLKMTKQEVKDEYKLQEGDPKVKGKIKQKQREMSQMRMMQSVPDADVVITNPTHYAVALQYDGEKHAAPQVLAKGADRVALRIREVAGETDVPIVENPELCRNIYYLCEIGDYVPEDLYHAVAEVLAFVYRMQGKV